MLKSFKTISCSINIFLFLRNKHSAEKHTSKELGESGLKTCVIALLRIFFDDYVLRQLVKLIKLKIEEDVAE